MSATRLSPVYLLFAWLLVLIAHQATADNDTQPVSIFRSRPDLEAPILTVIERTAELQSPGYYFLSPYQTNAQDGVYIYDNDGDLVYSSFGSDGSGTSHSPQTCQYKGKTHLCFYQGQQMMGWGHGHGVIMNENYRIVQSVEPAGTYQASSDMHEFTLIHDGNSALMTQYVRSVYDLCIEPWNLCDGLGYIQSGLFQEVDVESGKAIFEWNSLNHVDPHESWVPPSSTEISGSGEHPSSPWDYFHINSVDKNADGDYLISARHASAIYKISGRDGHVIWRLNGLLSDYALMDGLSFSSQHDARFVSDNKTMTVISLYDNASNGFNITKTRSQGLIIAIDHTTKEARAIHVQDPPPDTGFSSRSQGNFQLLPDGNKIMCYGNDAYFSEHDFEGNVVFYGNLALTSMMNYRVHKSNDWVGQPLTKPAVWTYSKYGYTSSADKMRTLVQANGYEYDTEAEGMMIYLSWNGATEIKSWRIFASTTPVSSSSSSSSSSTWPKLPSPPPKITDALVKWTEIATISKYGFETLYKHPEAHQYIYIEALDQSNNVLGTSDVQETFVPNEKTRDMYCDALACKFMPSDEERQRLKEQEEQQQQQQHSKDEDEVANNDKPTPIKGTILSHKLTLAIIVFVGLLLIARWTFAHRFTGRRPSLSIMKGKVMDVVLGTSSHRRVTTGGSYRALDLDEVLEDGTLLSDDVDVGVEDALDQRLFGRVESPVRR